MKKFSIDSGRRSRPTSHGKGYPRHLLKQIALDEDSASFEGYSSPVREKDFVRRDRSWIKERSQVSWNHIDRWLSDRVGQDVDKLYSEFLETWKLSKVPQGPWSLNNPRATWECFVFEKDFSWDRNSFKYLVDSQNRLIRNPDYKTYKQRNRENQKTYPLSAVIHNKAVLEELEKTLKKSTGSSIGPIGIPTYLWIKHPEKPGKLIKAPVQLIRSSVFNPGVELRDYWTMTSEQLVLPKIPNSRIEELQNEYKAVAVVTDVHIAKSRFSVEVRSSQVLNRIYREEKTWTFVVSKNWIES